LHWLCRCFVIVMQVDELAVVNYLIFRFNLRKGLLLVQNYFWWSLTFSVVWGQKLTSITSVSDYRFKITLLDLTERLILMLLFWKFFRALTSWPEFSLSVLHLINYRNGGFVVILLLRLWGVMYDYKWLHGLRVWVWRFLVLLLGLVVWDFIVLPVACFLKSFLGCDYRLKLL
jgi:hypothetical protein